MTSFKTEMKNGVECVLVRNGRGHGILIRQLAKDLGAAVSTNSDHPDVSVCSLCPGRREAGRCTCHGYVRPDAKYAPLLLMRGVELEQADDS